MKTVRRYKCFLSFKHRFPLEAGVYSSFRPSEPIRRSLSAVPLCVQLLTVTFGGVQNLFCAETVNYIGHLPNRANARDGLMSLVNNHCGPYGNLYVWHAYLTYKALPTPLIHTVLVEVNQSAVAGTAVGIYRANCIMSSSHESQSSHT